MESPVSPSTSSVPTAPSSSAFAQGLAQENQAMNQSNRLFVVLAVVAIFLGLGTGVGGAMMTAAPKSESLMTQTQTTGKQENTGTSDTSIKVGQVFGAKDTKAFKDPVEGVLVSGGIGSEGSHHIVRPGGESQNVYLTSSIVDLKMFEGAKVKIWGETFKAQKAGWLMDVGRVEVEALNAPLPDGAKPAQGTGNQDF